MTKQQAAVVANNIAIDINNNNKISAASKKEFEQFKYSQLGEMLTLGNKNNSYWVSLTFLSIPVTLQQQQQHPQ